MDASNADAGASAPPPHRRRSALAAATTLRAELARIAASPAALASIIEAQTAPMIAFRADRTIVAINLAAEQLFGYGRRELDGASTEDLLPERLRQPAAPPVALTEDVVSLDLPGRRKDGTERPLAWTYGGMEVGDAPIFVVVAVDRVELDEALDALRTSEERLHLLLDGVRDHALVMLDEEARVSTWSAGAELIKQWTTAEALGLPYDTFFSEEDRAAQVPGTLLQAATRGSVEASGWRVRKDGSKFYAESFLSPLRGEDGKLRGYAIVTHDLTTRMRAEEDQRRLLAERSAREAAEDAERRARLGEARLGRIHRFALALARATTPGEVAEAALRECLAELGAAGGAMYMIAEDARTLTLLHESGHPDGSLDDFRALSLEVPMPLTDAARTGVAGFYDSFEACAACYPALRDAIARGDFEASVALPLVTRAGPIGVLGVRYQRVLAFDEHERSLLGTIAELASQALERARLLAAEQRARASAEAANRSKDEFLAMLGHELRNPLAPIAMAVQILKLRETGASNEHDIIERQVRHMTRLVDDLLDVSRIAQGRVDLARRDTPLAEVLTRAVEMVSPLYEQREHRLIVDGPPPGLTVNADPVRLAQVVSNLLTNAAKYTPSRGRVWLTATLEGQEAVVCVRDEGEGIASDLLPHVFDLFVQGARTFDRSAGGLGLGLALVKNLVTLHGGTVSATSEGVGRGTEVTVRLPALPERVADEPAAAVAPTTRKVRRVLVVDDNDDAAEMLATALEHLGYEVASAPDGPEALLRLVEFGAEVAILDLGLPGIDGFELAQRITRDAVGTPPRLIALTGYGRPHDVARSLAAGFEAHLTKPVDFDAVVDAIEGRASRAVPRSNSSGRWR